MLLFIQKCLSGNRTALCYMVNVGLNRAKGVLIITIKPTSTTVPYLPSSISKYLIYLFSSISSSPNSTIIIFLSALFFSINSKRHFRIIPLSFSTFKYNNSCHLLTSTSASDFLISVRYSPVSLSKRIFSMAISEFLVRAISS